MLRLLVAILLLLSAGGVRTAAQDPVIARYVRVLVKTDGSAMPKFLLVLTAAKSNVMPRRMVASVIIPEQPAFPRLNGEYRLTVSGLPLGYSVKSLSTGQTNLLTTPIRMVSSETPDIKVELQFAPPPATVKVMSPD